MKIVKLWSEIRAQRQLTMHEFSSIPRTVTVPPLRAAQPDGQGKRFARERHNQKQLPSAIESFPSSEKNRPPDPALFCCIQITDMLLF